MFTAPSQYDVIRQLGCGGFGIAYLVRPVVAGASESYVIKEVNLARLEAGAVDAENRARARKMTFDEAEIMQSLDHRNIVKVFSSFLDGDLFRISMEYCDSGTLKDAIVEQQGVYFDETKIRHWMAQIATTLRFLHNKKILHRDVKADNIFLTANRTVVKLGDFGIAKSLNTTAVGHTFVGTVTHMPPELLRGEPYTFKSEVWAFGILMYEIIALALPFYGPHFAYIFNLIMGPQPVPPLPNQYSCELRDFVETRLLNKDAEGRPSMLEIIGESFILQALAEIANKIASNESPPQQSKAAKDMLIAAENSDLAVIQQALDTNSAIYLSDPETWKGVPDNDDHDTPLHMAAWKDDVDSLKLMWPKLSQLATCQNTDYQAPIHLAALSNSIKAVEFMLQESPSLLELKNDYFGRTALHAAADQGHDELVGILVNKYGANVWAKSNSQDQEQCPIHLAAALGHLDIVDYLLLVEPDLSECRTKDGNLPIHMAAMAGQTEVVDYLISDKEISPEVANDRYGRTVLHMAAEFGHIVLVKTLVEKFKADIKAKTNTSDFEKLPVHMAAWRGHLSVVKYLVELDPTLAQSTDGQGLTPCDRALASGDLNQAPSIVEYLTSVQ